MPVLRVLDLLTCGPSRVLGIPAPGLVSGMRADCILFDPMISYRLSETGSLSRSVNTPFINKELRGRVEAVWKGRLVYRDGEFVD